MFGWKMTGMQLLLIEDDEVIASELTLHWRDRGWSVHRCRTLSEASRFFGDGRVEFVILDLQLPDGDGAIWLESLRRRDRTLPVIVLTARDRVADRVKGLRLGADDYLVKPFAIDEIDARIDAVLRRSRGSDQGKIQCGSLLIVPAEGSVYVDNEPLDLLPREVEVLGLLAARSPRVVSKRAITDALAERNLELEESAAELYVSRLRRKLVNAPVTIETVRGFGYRLVISESTGEGKS